MRPVALVVEGFTCFKDRQTLDLAGLDLFALTGPTGAGKSSVLDAMIFALYGRVPRVGKSVSELVSLGRDQLSVILELELGGERLRVMRKVRRGKSSDAVLELVVGGGAPPRSIASGVREVDAEITRRLGLGYDAFTQAVVLPQGQFAKFMQSEPRERRRILSEMLRLRVYDLMREDASKRKTRLDAEVTAKQNVMSDEYGGATREVLAATEAEVVTLAARAETERARVGAARSALADVQVLRDKTVTFETAEATLQKMTAEESVLRAAETKLARAERALPVVPRLDAADAARARSEDAERKVVAAKAADAEALRVWVAAEARRVEAERAAEATSALREELSTLDAAMGKLGPLGSARERRARAEAEVKELAVRAEAESARAEEAEAEARRATDEVAEIERSIEAMALDVDRLARVDSLRERASELGAARARATSAATANAAASEAATSAKKIDDEARDEWEQARSAHGKQQGRVETYEDELREAERADAAATLRRSLHDGEACPVCEQIVRAVPPAGETARVDALVKKLEVARKDEEKARQKLDRASKAHAAAETAMRNAAEAAERAAVEAKDTSRVRDEAERALIAESAGDVDAGDAPIEVRVLAAGRALGEQRRKHDELRRALDAASRRRTEAERARVAAHAESVEIRAKDASAQSRIVETAREIEALEREIAEATKGRDVVEARANVVASIEALERGRDEARRAEADADRTRRATETRATESADARDAAKRDASERDEEARRACEEAGFATSAEVRGAAITRAELDGLARTIEGIRRMRSDAESVVRTVGAELSGRRASEADRIAANDTLAAAESAERETLRMHAARARDVAAMKDRVERAEKLSAELARNVADRNVFGRLATDLRSERFQAFLMEEAFRELVAGASIRLRSLTERYGLEVLDDAFVVVDHDNARERRSADTLSGGETFLASLALALELSAQVQRAAGAVALDSVFIDEGFGTLDPETLDTVAGALESLPTGGRMVGIITHIPELSARLPARVVVERSGTGSKLRVETD